MPRHPVIIPVTRGTLRDPRETLKTSSLHTLELSSLLEVEGNRFVANHVETGFQKSLGNLEVQVVLDYDRNKVDAFVFGKRLLLFRHLLIGRVDPGRF